jgi:acetyltransferase-like isoleucine patch superfamily enzyme
VEGVSRHEHGEHSPAFGGQGLLAFVKAKVSSYSIKGAMMLELEAYLAWPFRGLPGLIGFVCRAAVYKMLFGELRSFCWISPNVYFAHCHKIHCGANFGVNSNSYLNAAGGLDIGDNVLLGANVVISSGQHQVGGPEKIVTLQRIIPKRIVIGDGVWIGANAVIMPGLTLGAGTVVGANAVVTHSTEPFSVVAGSPARVLRMRGAGEGRPDPRADLTSP